MASRNVVGAVLLLIVSAGCEEAVDPIIGSEYPFTIWGFMNAGADTQYVRVYAISDRIGGDATRIDADVISTNLTTGERRTWTYMTVHFDSVNTGHVFWSPFRAVNDQEYRLEVIRSDGMLSSAEVRVPSEVEFDVDVYAEGAFAPVRINGDIPVLIGPKVTYDLINVPPPIRLEFVPPPVRHPVTVEYDHALKQTSTGWEVLVDMVRDTSAVRAEYVANCLVTASVPNIWLHDVTFSVVAADSTWRPPGGIFDPNVLVVPGTMSNVENGYGFFGAGQELRFTWIPTVDARLDAGYRFESACSAGPFPDQCPETPPVIAPLPCVDKHIEDIWEYWLR